MRDTEILDLIDTHIQKLRDAQERRPNWRPYVWQITALVVLKNQIKDHITAESEARRG